MTFGAPGYESRMGTRGGHLRIFGSPRITTSRTIKSMSIGHEMGLRQYKQMGFRL